DFSFFFSSRRRHTRCLSDWSSDVCSSDLLKPQLRGVWQVPGQDGAYHEILYWVDKNNPQGPTPINPATDSQYQYWDIPVRRWARSEERRVGKEWRGGRWAAHGR